jgi:hypothetical protein
VPELRASGGKIAVPDAFALSRSAEPGAPPFQGRARQLLIKVEFKSITRVQE